MKTAFQTPPVPPKKNLYRNCTLVCKKTQGTGSNDSILEKNDAESSLLNHDKCNMKSLSTDQMNKFGHKLLPPKIPQKIQRTHQKSLPTHVTVCGKNYVKINFIKSQYPEYKRAKKPLMLPKDFNPDDFK